MPGITKQAQDTSTQAAEEQVKAWRRMGGRRRLETAFELSDAALQLSLDGLRARHPLKTTAELRRMLAEAS